MEALKKEESDRIRNAFLRMRTFVGLLGVALPWVVLFGLAIERALGLAEGQLWSGYPHSISAYYHTNMRDVFVGILVTIATFLLAYEGHPRKRGEILSDRVLSSIAGLFALGVAFFPVGVSGIAHYAHLLCALSLFACLILFSLVIFTRSPDLAPEQGTHLGSGRIYVACGLVMIVAVAAICLCILLGDDSSAVFWLELVALTAFGVSWLTKGEAIEGVVSWTGQLPVTRLDEQMIQTLQRVRQVGTTTPEAERATGEP